MAKINEDDFHFPMFLENVNCDRYLDWQCNKFLLQQGFLNVRNDEKGLNLLCQTEGVWVGFISEGPFRYMHMVGCGDPPYSTLR